MKSAFHHTAVPATGAAPSAADIAALRRLHAAVAAGDLPAVKALVAAGADPAAALEGPMPSLSSTALHVAAGRGQTAVLAWLLDQGISADHCPAALKTRHRALMSAALGGHTAAAALLLARGAAANARDYKSYTALHMASDKGHADVVAVLLDAGADPSLRDRFGLRAQDVCCNNPAEAMDATARRRLHRDLLDLFYQASQTCAQKDAADPAVLAEDVTVFPVRLGAPDDKKGKARRRAA